MSEKSQYFQILDDASARVALDERIDKLSYLEVLHLLDFLDKKGLTFERLRKVSLDRAKTAYKNRPFDSASLIYWTNAIAGEAGEACNWTKKLDRALPTDPVPDEIIKGLSKEVADIAIYADLLASKLGMRLEDLIVQKFNEVSERVGAPHRL